MKGLRALFIAKAIGPFFIKGFALTKGRVFASALSKYGYTKIYHPPLRRTEKGHFLSFGGVGPFL